MSNSLVTGAAKCRYGPVSFVSTLVTILAVEFAAWVTAIPYPPLMIYTVPPVLLVVDLVAYAILARRPGALGQIGRGILIGSLSVPVSVVVFTIAFIVAHAIGPI
jgi:hypothetical protein